MTQLTPVFSRYWDEPEPWSLATYRRHDGYRALERALAMDPDDVIALVKDSGLRGGGGAVGLAGRAPRPGQAEATVSRGGRPVCLPDRGEQCGIHCQRAADPAQRRGLVPVDGLREIAGLHAVFVVRTRHHTRSVRSAARHHAARTVGVRGRGTGRTLTQVLDTRRLFDPAVDRRTPRRATGLRGHGRRRVDAWHQGTADLRRHHLR